MDLHGKDRNPYIEKENEIEKELKLLEEKKK